MKVGNHTGCTDIVAYSDGDVGERHLHLLPAAFARLPQQRCGGSVVASQAAMPN
jgi:hypothetical protein